MSSNKNVSIISLRQLLILTVAQAGGAAIIFLPGMIEAGRDVWISNIIASLIAYPILYCNYLPLSLCPGCSMTQTLNRYWGRILGGLVNIYYLMFFLILSVLVVSDVFYMGKITMPDTPGYIFVIFFLIPAIYAIKLGVEVFTRFVEFSTPILAILYIVIFAFTIPKLNFQNMLPIMAEGIKPVIAGSLLNLNFPYAQILPIAFLYKHMGTDSQKGNKFIKYIFWGIFIATLLLSIRSLASVMAFEEHTLKTLTFPPLSTIRIIELGDVIQRLDPFFYGIFYMNTFFKLIITFYVASEIVSDLFNLGEPKDLALPMALFIGVLMPYGIHRFDMIFQLVMPFFILSLPLIFPIPILLFITIKIKNKDKQKSDETADQ